MHMGRWAGKAPQEEAPKYKERARVEQVWAFNNEVVLTACCLEAGMRGWEEVSEGNKGQSWASISMSNV